MASNPVFHHSFMAMGTRMDVVFPDMDAEDGRDLCAEIAVLVEDIEQSLSHFRPDSPISRLNRDLEKQRDHVLEDEILFEALAIASEFNQATEGYFDPALGRVFDTGKNKDKAVSDSRGNMPFGFKHVHLDHKTKTVSCDITGIAFDFGAMGKGYALDHVREHLDICDVSSALICFGESSILAYGSHPAGHCWPLAITHPDDRKTLMHEFELIDASLSVSSTILNGGDDSGTLNRHILDPISGEPIMNGRIVAVAAKSATAGEVLSTALLAAPAPVRLRLLKHPAVISHAEFNFDEKTHQDIRSWH